MEKLTQPQQDDKFWSEFFKRETIAATKLYFEPLTTFWSLLKKLHSHIKTRLKNQA
jgi:hypothetical protein